MTSIRSYFKTRCEDLGRVEHKDAFNFSNIGSSVLPKAFHIELDTFNGSPTNQSVLETTADVNVRLFFQGYREPIDGVNAAVEEGERLVKLCLRASNRVTGKIKNVSFNSMRIEALDGSNDNALISTLSFTASALTNVEGV